MLVEWYGPGLQALEEYRMDVERSARQRRGDEGSLRQRGQLDRTPNRRAAASVLRC